MDLIEHITLGRTSGYTRLSKLQAASPAGCLRQQQLDRYRCALACAAIQSAPCIGGIVACMCCPAMTPHYVVWGWAPYSTHPSLSQSHPTAPGGTLCCKCLEAVAVQVQDVVQSLGLILNLQAPSVPRHTVHRCCQLPAECLLSCAFCQLLFQLLQLSSAALSNALNSPALMAGSCYKGASGGRCKPHQLSSCRSLRPVRRLGSHVGRFNVPQAGRVAGSACAGCSSVTATA